MKEIERGLYLESLLYTLLKGLVVFMATKSGSIRATKELPQGTSHYQILLGQFPICIFETGLPLIWQSETST